MLPRREQERAANEPARPNRTPRSHRSQIRRENMFDLIKKALLTGVGLGVMTKEKVEELAAELSKKADLTEKQGEALIADLLVESEKAAQALDGKVSAAVRRALEKMEIVTKRDVTALEERIAEVEQRVASDDSEATSE